MYSATRMETLIRFVMDYDKNFVFKDPFDFLPSFC